MSSAVATRCNGAIAFTASWRSPHVAVQGVSTRPGATPFTRTLLPTNFASRVVMWFTAAFETAYGNELPV